MTRHWRTLDHDASGGRKRDCMDAFAYVLSASIYSMARFVHLAEGVCSQHYV
ncbi:hypothetical protein IQ25_04118 [Novosphingobium taihuense]|nr:hypothetical protein IQ25_04118 [Novosphingobium taihuense]